MNRRRFIRASAGTAALAATNRANAIPSNSQLGANTAGMTVPLLIEDYQVIQRDKEEKGACLIRIPDNQGRSQDVDVRIVDETGRIWVDGHFKPQESRSVGRHVLIDNIPMGGPYTISLGAQQRRKSLETEIAFRHILVGDIWILGGQSNMFGAAVQEERLPALPYLNMLNLLHTELDSHWCSAIPPIHRSSKQLAPNRFKRMYPGATDIEIKQMVASNVPAGAIGPAYFFAKELFELGSNVPIGLIPCAIGAALAVWDPVKRDQNRYGFLHHHVMRAGGRVKGMLWYQGEQDAVFGDEQKVVTKPSLIYPFPTYGDQFTKFVAALRSDFHNPELVVILAQICRHHNSEKGRQKAWEAVRDIQRRIPQRLPYAHTVTTVDLDLTDGIHIDYWSQKRLGRRMAYVALPYVSKGVPPRSEIRLKSVKWKSKPAIVVEFEGVSGNLRSPGRPTGFQLKKKETGEDVDWIFRTDFDRDRPARLILKVAGNQREGLVLFYAPGAAPYANIVDDNDMAVPAFGPIDVT